MLGDLARRAVLVSVLDLGPDNARHIRLTFCNIKIGKGQLRYAGRDRDGGFGDDLVNVPDNQTICAFDLEFPSANKSYLIRPGTYQIELKIAGSNCPVVKKTLELTITGLWFPEEDRMFDEGLGIN